MATVDHHYVPKCYLKRWANPATGAITTFQHDHKGLRSRRSAPAGTGYKKHLYTATMNPQIGDSLETKLLQQVDSNGAKLLERFTAGGPIEVNPQETMEWSMFLLSLMHRSPGRIEHFDRQVAEEFPSFAENMSPEVEADYERLRRPGDPETLAEFFRAAAPKDVELGRTILLEQLLTSERVGMTLTRMVSAVVRFNRPRHELLTSDRPLIITDGLEKPNAVVLLALSPLHLFVAGHTEQQVEPYSQTKFRDRVIKYNNTWVCRQAERFVYSTNSAQTSFVNKYFPRPAAT